MWGLSGQANQEEEKEEENVKLIPESYKNGIIINTSKPDATFIESTGKIYTETITLTPTVDFYFKNEIEGNEIAMLQEYKLLVERVEDLDETMESVMEKQINGTWKCNLSGKIPPSGTKNYLRHFTYLASPT